MVTELAVECLLREATADDVPFVLSSWLQSAAAEQGGIATCFARKTFFAEHERLVRESVLPRSRVTVAASPGDSDVIRGWACSEVTEHGTLLHYVYVRHDWRGLGIARHLVDIAGPIALQTHRTRGAESPYPFNPYPLFLGATWRPSPKLFSITTSSTHSREPRAEIESPTLTPTQT